MENKPHKIINSLFEQGTNSLLFVVVEKVTAALVDSVAVDLAIFCKKNLKNYKFNQVSRMQTF